MAQQRAELGLPADALVVLMAAQTSPRKGVIEFVEAAILLVQTGRAGSAHFLLAGDGPLDKKLHDLVDAAGMS